MGARERLVERVRSDFRRETMPPARSRRDAPSGCWNSPPAQSARPMPEVGASSLLQVKGSRPNGVSIRFVRPCVRAPRLLSGASAMPTRTLQRLRARTVPRSRSTLATTGAGG